MPRLLALGLALITATAACSSAAEPSPITAGANESADSSGSPIPQAPLSVMAPLDPEVAADLDLVFADLTEGTDYDAIRRLGGSGDPRIGWLFADLLRFFPSGPVTDATVAAFEELTGTNVTAPFPWNQVTDWLISWDLEAPPGYVEWKRRPFEIIEPAWQPFFDDTDAVIDWRHVSWGGVLIDDRPIGETSLPCPRGCIPALNDPIVTDAAGGGWYPDDGIVFGVVVDGEARAYPKNQMEVHEMVNDTLGGRRIGVPYCTLCGSAQAYFTDAPPAGVDTIELRTSGLLIRSNKVMFDLNTFSIFDTFTGRAVSGPLHRVGFQLEQTSVTTATWAEWKAAHPNTTIVAQDGGIGRSYPDDPLRGRDDDGPIFPIGDVDPRLAVQAPVLGVITSDEIPMAFPVDTVRQTLEAGNPVVLGDVEVRLIDGVLAAFEAGEPAVSHQAFWFAWSQFHPETGVWTPLG